VGIRGTECCYLCQQASRWSAAQRTHCPHWAASADWLGWWEPFAGNWTELGATSTFLHMKRIMVNTKQWPKKLNK